MTRGPKRLGRRVWSRAGLGLCVVASGFVGLLIGAGPAAATTQNVTPILDCSWKDPSTGMYNSEFGYNNPNSTTVTVAVGGSNYFTSGGLSQNAGQPTSFAAGKHDNAFIVTNQQNIQWVLQGTNINAPGNPTCSSNPGAGPFYGNAIVFPILDCSWKDPTTGFYNVQFGYNNPFTTTETVTAGGSQNQFTSGGLAYNSGQPTTFSAGKHDNAFLETVNPNTNWFLTGNNLTAPGSTTCSSNPGSGHYYGSTPVVYPVLECDFVDSKTGKSNSLFGYNNPYSSSQTVAVGSQNQFSGSGAAQNSGQPSTFLGGKNDNLFVVTHQGTISWSLTNNNASAPGTKTCATNPVPIISGRLGSLVVAGAFAVVGLAVVWVRRRRSARALSSS
jgi:hypothetical protein